MASHSSGFKRPYASIEFAKSGKCYAAPGGSRPGIYFTLEEARKHHTTSGQQSINSFSTVAEAKKFMGQYGFSLLDNGGWISSNMKPILYHPKKFGSASGGSESTYHGNSTTSSASSPVTPHAKDIATSAKFEFDDVQKEAIDAALQGKSVFITGVAGTGKSMVTREIVNNAKALKMEIAACAPTGTFTRRAVVTSPLT
jgi:transcriptional regulator with AAA-type ATPase domain